ncbi:MULTISPECIES: exodeoxyribonuclease V subunit gamma [Methylococcus]|uniref:RecBCD enzyme subunit RecC n=1 Tax=Methylococcus capsulatus TaxID=414 RepID=A0ABZ2F0U3_METCP|nr:MULTISPECIES: exodeoxyribonuclease V subunit gamma [Methylococcus]
MAPLNIVFSNRFEALIRRLFDDLAQGPADPFAAEQIIVPSAGVRRRLELDYADRFGVCANVEFHYLAQWLWAQIGQVIEVGESSPFEPSTLTWRVFRALGETALVSAHPRLASYLERADAAMRFDLAQRVARLMEQYITYRPDWLAAWQDGKPACGLPDAGREDEAWQAALWRALMDEMAVRFRSSHGAEREHPSAVFFRAVESMGPEETRRAGLPERAHLFCLPTIPPLYLDILGKLARWTDLHLYVLNPCREYWFEIVDPRRLSYLEVRGDALYRETGNRLLASWGQQTQAHIDLLFDKAETAVIDDVRFEPPGRISLLAAVQEAILNLRDPEPASCASVALDRSIEVHVCHSLVRELEVLHDQLLAMLGEEIPHASSIKCKSAPDRLVPEGERGDGAPREPPLKVSDILVVTPRLEEVAPLIDAVFGTAPVARRIPYTITGLRRAVANPAAAALLALLDLFASRCKASAVYEFLQRPLVYARFGLGPDDLERVHDWFRLGGIHWGLDGAHRKAVGVPEVERHSFADGLDRLFLGYALGEVPAPFDGRLPAADAEGLEALALGGFAHFVDLLAHWHRVWSTPATPAAWGERLNALVSAFLVEAPETVADLQEVREAIAALGRHWVEAAVSAAIEPDVVRVALEALLDDPVRGAMPSGRVTFTAMASLRSLPYRVVCVIGLNDGVFPSPDHPAEFDLIAQAPRRGDRQRRYDERNLFLDLLLAARDRLYLSYTGRSVRDNSHLPPSTLLSELLDYVLPLVAAEGGSLDEARRRLVVEHPLQAFSPVYFDAAMPKDARLVSFNSEYCEALRAARSPRPLGDGQGARAHDPQAQEPENPPVTLSQGERADHGSAGPNAVEEHNEQDLEPAPFFPAPLAAPEPEWREPNLEDLKRFFRNPCRYLLERRLGLSLAEGEAELADEEPFLPRYFDRGEVAERLLPLILSGATEEAVEAAARAGNEYPQGRLGEVLLEGELARIRDYAERIAEQTREDPLEPLAGTLVFEIEGETWALSGALGQVRPRGLVRWRYDDTRPVDYLSGWLDHLFLNALAARGVAPATTWISRDGEYRLRPVAAAQERLRELVALYREGLRLPLHFFPRSAWACALKLRQGESEAAEREARKRWEGSDHRRGESEDPACRQALRGQADPLDGEFFRAAQTMFGPLLDHLEDERIA